MNHIKSLNPPGRFLIDNLAGEWEEIPSYIAIVKTCQAFREHQSKIRKGLQQDKIDSLSIFTTEEATFILETFKK